MYKKIGKVGASLAALAAIAVGSSAIAGAATAKKNSTTPTPPAAGQGAYGYPQGPPPSGFRGDHDGHGGFPGHKPETPLTGDTAQKVKGAALAKVKGGTIERVETNTDGGGPYEAHMRKSDGSEVIVLVDKQFDVTAVKAFGGGRGGPGHYGGPPPAGTQQGGLQGAPPPGAPEA